MMKIKQFFQTQKEAVAYLEKRGWVFLRLNCMKAKMFTQPNGFMGTRTIYQTSQGWKIERRISTSA